MKIVYFNIPAHGHVNPTLPLTAELIKRGHEVIYYGFPEFEAKIRATGAEFRAYNIPFEDFKTMDMTNMMFILWKLMSVSYSITNDTIPEIAALSPDLILHDSMASWGKYIARATKTPAISTCTTFAFDPLMRRIPSWKLMAHLCYDWFTNWNYFTETRRMINELAKKHDFPPHLPVELFNNYEDNNIVFTSQTIQPFGKDFDLSRYHFVGCSIAKRTEMADFDWNFCENKPLIYVSLGTLVARDANFFKIIMQIFAQKPYRLLLSIGEFLEVEDLGEIPLNCVVRKYVPQLEALQRAAVFVTHGGINSLHESIYFGVPMVMVPQQAEQVYNAEHLEDLGCGIVTKPTAKALQKAVEKVINNGFYKINCKKFANDLQNAGGFVKAADFVVGS